MNLALTQAARDAARTELAGEKVLRIAFAGGCGALGFSLSTPRRGVDGDVAVQLPEITVFLDHRAASELEGATLDYDEEEGFLLDHPSWGRSC